MNWKKAVLWMVFCVVFISNWMIFSYNQAPVYKGENSDGNWSAEYVPMKTSKDMWQGHIMWGGRGEPEVNEVIFTRGDSVHELSVEEREGSHFRDLPSHSPAPLENAEVSYRIKWSLDGVEHEEIINLIPHKRLFVIPRFFYGSR